MFSHSLGHEDALLRPRLSAGCGFRKETIAGMRRNDETRRNLPLAERAEPDGVAPTAGNSAALP